MRHQLPPVTEKHLQQEVETFLQANRLYHEAIWTLRMRKAGYFKEHFTLEATELNLKFHFEDAFNKIPTLWLVELNELLNQKHIKV